MTNRTAILGVVGAVIAIGIWIFSGGREEDSGEGDARPTAPIATPDVGEPPREETLREGTLREGTLREEVAKADPPISGKPESEASEITKGAGKHTLRGRVLDPSQAPIEGASVEVRLAELREFAIWDRGLTEAPSPSIVRCITDSNGAFETKLDTLSRLDISVVAEGFSRAERSDCSAGKFHEFVLEVGGMLTGTITDAETADPIVGASLTLWDRERGVVQAGQTTTGPDGRYTFPRLTTGSGVLQVSAPTHAPPPFRMIVLGDQDEKVEDFALSRGLPLRGVVEDAETGAPIVGATVRLGAIFGSSTVSDARGEFVLTGAIEGRADTLTVSATGYADEQVALRSLEERVHLKLTPGRGVVGSVVSWDGSPIEKAYVAAVSERSDDGLDWKSTFSAEDGTFRIADLAADRRHALLIKKPGYASTVLDLPSREEQATLLDIGALQIAEESTLAGRVISQTGATATGLTLRMQSTTTNQQRIAEGAVPLDMSHLTERTATPDEQGQFYFDGLRASECTIAAYAIENGDAIAEVSVAVGASTHRDGVELVVPVSGQIAGRVLGPNGEPPAMSFVVATPRDGGEPAGMARTAAEGAFEIKGLEPGLYRLTAYPMPFGSGVVDTLPLLPFDTTDIETGREDLALTLRQGRALSGRITSAAGPIAGAVVRIETRDDLPMPPPPARSDKEGAFQLAVEPHGVITLTAVVAPKPGDDAPRSAKVVVPEGKDDVEIWIE